MLTANIKIALDRVEKDEEVYLAEVPKHATYGDAGADVKAFLPDGPITLEPDAVVMVPTGIRVAVPTGLAMLVIPRSSMGKRKYTIPNSPGLVDPPYRGEVKVLVHNQTQEPLTINHRDRVGQLMVVDAYQQSYEVVADVSLLGETLRGEGGFGSTGEDLNG